MNDNKYPQNKDIIGMIENAHLLRKLFIRRSNGICPLHFSQVSIMKTIQKNENCTQTDIAEKLRVTPASVATSTKRLQKAGLITKTVDSENLRCKRLALTTQGKDILSKNHKIFDEYDSLVLDIFNDNEKKQLFEYLDRMILKMKEIEGINDGTSGPMELTVLLRCLMEMGEKKEINSPDAIICSDTKGV